MTRVKLSVEPRFLRIPTQWEIRHPSGQSVEFFYTRSQFNYPQRKAKRTVPVAVPSFSENVDETNLVEVDAWELRNRFFQMKQTEASALSFLQEVGVWAIEDDDHVSGSDKGGLSGAFGARFVQGWAAPIALSDMWDVQRDYRKLLADPGQLRRRFGLPPPATAPIDEKKAFAIRTTFENTLPVHIEWRRGHAIAVAEAVTWNEMMMATMQIDLLQGARFVCCRRPDCHIPFPVTTAHHKIYCSWYCGHIEAVRRSRKGKE